MSKRSRKERKRAKKTIKKTVEKLEQGLAKMMVLRAHHDKRIKKLDTKIAAQEELIKITKEEEAEV